MTPLTERKCNPLPDGSPALEGDQLAGLLKQIHGDWTVADGRHLSRMFTFPDFVTALAFVNQVGELAEADNHHPDLTLSWGKVGIEIWTHTVGGLSENDFILAAKIDKLLD